MPFDDNGFIAMSASENFSSEMPLIGLHQPLPIPSISCSVS